MSHRDIAPLHRSWIVGIALAVGLGICLSTLATDAIPEEAQLAAMIRQLDLLDRAAQRSELSEPTNGRYHFDYARLRTDIARIRAGIEDYLTPRRAQPRDLLPLDGRYRLERDKPQ